MHRELNKVKLLSTQPKQNKATLTKLQVKTVFLFVLLTHYHYYIEKVKETNYT